MSLTIAQALRWPGLDPVDARVLLQAVLGVNHAHLIAHSERALTDNEAESLEALFQQRLAGHPVAYLVGRREFFGRDFLVSPAVLIPRPETELLVELALARIAAHAAPRLLDLGTGSGCIALTLALERPDARVTAVDVSEAALTVAGSNAEALHATNVTLRMGDWFEAVRAQTFDLIVSNPPYIASGDAHLASGDVRFEPRSALTAGPAGLDDIAHIVARAPLHLAPGGWVLIEHGWDQADAVARLFADAGFAEVILATDLAGHPRVTGGRTPRAGGLTARG